MSDEKTNINNLVENISDDDISTYTNDSDNSSVIDDNSDDDDIPPPPTNNDYDSDDPDIEADTDYQDVYTDAIDAEHSNFQNFNTISDDDSDDESTNSDDNYLQKFNNNDREKILEDYYPELHQHNIDEIKTLSIINRDNNGKIIDPLHQTLPFITKYEKTRILGERSKQIAAGAQPLIPIDNTTIDSYLIAEKEFNEKAIPFIIKRPLPSGGCEYWKLCDLEILV